MHSYCFVAGDRETLLDALDTLGLVATRPDIEIDEDGLAREVDGPGIRYLVLASEAHRAVDNVILPDADIAKVSETAQVMTPMRPGARARVYFETALTDDDLLTLSAGGLSIEAAEGWPVLLDGEEPVPAAIEVEEGTMPDAPAAQPEPTPLAEDEGAHTVAAEPQAEAVDEGPHTVSAEPPEPEDDPGPHIVHDAPADDDGEAA